MNVKDIVSTLEQWAPPAYQESYDNCGLLVGDMDRTVKSVLITLDITEQVIEEAITTGCNLIISHHPLIFNRLKRVTSGHWVERCVREAIRHDINIYAIHTNLDHVKTGVNRQICDRIGLTNLQVLAPKTDSLSKLVTFVPSKNKQVILEAIFEAGGGQIGEYDQCSFQLDGTGTFRPSPVANPTIGQAGIKEEVNETRIEVVLPVHLESRVLSALIKAHPYEEVAYYLTRLTNANQDVGSGMVGDLSTPMSTLDFISHLKKQMNLQLVRHTALTKASVRRVAVCGGAGAFLLPKAKAANADIFISSDFKYHDFFEGDGVIIADIGHYESEIFTKDLLHDFLREKFANIAFRLSGVVTNPLIYT